MATRRAKVNAAMYSPLPQADADDDHHELADTSLATMLDGLPEMLQAQVVVTMDTRKRKQARAAQAAQKRTGQRVGWVAEQLLWVGTPHLRTRTVLAILAVWSVLLVAPVLVLVELLDEGGMVALLWAFASVFIFVPRVSRGSREAFVLTSQRAFVSKRTMFCSITTTELEYDDVTSARLVHNADFTGTIVLEDTPRREMEPVVRVKFDRVMDLRGASRILDALLPKTVVEATGGMAGPPTAVPTESQ